MQCSAFILIYKVVNMVKYNNLLRPGPQIVPGPCADSNTKIQVLFIKKKNIQ